MSSSSTRSSGSDTRGTVATEQLIGECFVKCAHIILSSRINSTGEGTVRSAKQASWFKLQVPEVKGAKLLLDKYKSERGVGLPLVIEIFIEPNRSSSPVDRSSLEGQLASVPGTLMERWQIFYSPLAALHPQFTATGLTRSQMARFSPQGLYKRLTILVRSLYSFCRVLPAYRLYRAVRHGGGSGAFCLGYRIHSSLYTSPSTCSTSSPLPEHFSFTPIDTVDGQLHIRVDYAASSTVKVIRQGVSRVPCPVPVFENYVDRATKPASSSTMTLSPPGRTVVPGQGRSLARRSWSNSFRLSPARLGESPVSERGVEQAQAEAKPSAPAADRSVTSTPPVQIPLKSTLCPLYSCPQSRDVSKRPEMKSSGDLNALARRGGGNATNEPFPDKPFSAPTAFLPRAQAIEQSDDKQDPQPQQSKQSKESKESKESKHDYGLTGKSASGLPQSPSPPALAREPSGPPMDGFCSEIIKLPVGSITSSSPASPCSFTAYPTSCSPDLFFAFTPPLARFSPSVVSTSIVSSGMAPSTMRRHSGGLRTTLGTSVSRSGDTNAPLISRLGYSVSPPGAISPPPLSMYAVPDIYGGEPTGKVHNRQGQLLLTCSGDHLEPAFDISMKNRALPGGVDSGVLYDGDDEADDCYEGGDPDQQDGNRSSVAAVGAFLGRVREAWAAVDKVDAVDKQCHSCHTGGINTIAAAFDFLEKAEAQLESDDADR